jgi:hypothetical protein
VFGGDHRKKEFTSLIFNCNSVDVPTNFAQNCIYQQKGCIAKWSVSEVSKISQEKFEKVWHFYQPKIQ